MLSDQVDDFRAPTCIQLALQKLSQASLVPRPIDTILQGWNKWLGAYFCFVRSSQSPSTTYIISFVKSIKMLESGLLPIIGLTWHSLVNLIKEWTVELVFPCFGQLYQISCQKLGKSIPVKGQSTQKHRQVNKNIWKKCNFFFPSLS